MLIGISGSGNVRDVLNAASRAKAMEATAIGFVGFDGGRLRDMLDICVVVPGTSAEEAEHVLLPHLCNLVVHCLTTIPAKEQG